MPSRALVSLESLDTEFFRRGMAYRQLEPVWGGRADTATDLRCTCAMGLAATGDLRAVADLTVLLTDPEIPVRCGAARAIACGNPFEAEAVLRLKVHGGDEDPVVIGECFSALLSLDAAHSAPFVATYPTHPDEALQEYAALSLGESRHPDALPPLQQAGEALVGTAGRSVLIRAAALHRTEPAFGWLLGIIASGTRQRAGVACEALEVYERNTRLIEQVSEAKRQRKDPI